MRKLNNIVTVLVVMLGFFVIASAHAAAQSLDAGANYNYVHTDAPPGGCGCFCTKRGQRVGRPQFDPRSASSGNWPASTAPTVPAT